MAKCFFLFIFFLLLLDIVVSAHTDSLVGHVHLSSHFILEKEKKNQRTEHRHMQTFIDESEKAVMLEG